MFWWGVHLREKQPLPGSHTKWLSTSGSGSLIRERGFKKASGWVRLPKLSPQPLGLPVDLVFYYWCFLWQVVFWKNAISVVNGHGVTFWKNCAPEQTLRSLRDRREEKPWTPGWAFASSQTQFLPPGKEGNASRRGERRKLLSQLMNNGLKMASLKKSFFFTLISPKYFRKSMNIWNS